MTATRNVKCLGRPLIAVGATVALLLMTGQGATAQRSTTDAAPQLQRLIEQLNVQLSMTYSANRRDYQQRREELAAAIDAWNASARSDADLAKMQAWIRQAIRTALPGSDDALPSVPDFAEHATPRPETVVRPSTDRPGPPEEPMAPLPEPTFAESDQPIDRPSSASEPESTPSPDATADTDTDASDEGGFDDLFGDFEESPTEPTVVNRPVTAPDDAAERPAGDLPDSSSAEGGVGDFWTQHPAARPLPAEMLPDDPFADDPKPDLLAAAEIAEQSDPVAQTTGYRGIDAETGSLNMPELKSRIRGYRRGLKQIEGELIDNRTLSADRLSQLVASLDELIEQREFTQLYLDTLSSAQRAALPELSSAAPTHQLLSERIDRRLELLGDNEPSGAERRDLERLEAAADTLRKMPLDE